MAAVTFSKDASGRITVVFQYDPLFVTKIKSIESRKWHPEEKYWTFPNTDGTLEKILKVFEDEEIQIDPTLTLQAEHTTPVIARLGLPRPSLRGAERRSNLHASSEQALQSHFEDLRRELVSRKYSYKIVKGYLFYNRDFLNFVKKAPHNVTESDVKDHLLYLAEEKQSATSTLNQAINALKFYYGTMLKKKFLYEIKRPRKDKKLPMVLSKEEVAKILSSVDNSKHKAILMLVYSSGLRVGEVVRLKPEDIDSKRMLVFIILLKVQRVGKIDIHCSQNPL
jgi:integrase